MVNQLDAPLSWAKLIEYWREAGRLDLRLEDSVACSCLFDDRRLDLAISWASSVSNEVLLQNQVRERFSDLL